MFKKGVGRGAGLHCSASYCLLRVESDPSCFYIWYVAEIGIEKHGLDNLTAGYYLCL